MARSTRRATRALTKASFTCAAALTAAAGIGALGGTAARANHLEYEIDVLGFTDTVHTNSTANFRQSTVTLMNGLGSVIGQSTRWDNQGQLTDTTGTSAWLYDNASGDGVLRRLGLVTSDADGGIYVQDVTLRQESFAQQLNERGAAAGYSQRFYTATEGDPGFNGQSVWIHRPGQATESERIGNLDPAFHTGTNNYQLSILVKLNNAEEPQAVGYAERYVSGVFQGYSAWMYDGTETIQIGLTDGDFAAGTAQFNQAQFLNDQGTAAGLALKQNGSNSMSTWIHIGGQSHEIGYTDANDAGGTHRQEGNNNFRTNSLVGLNSQNQVFGHSARFNASDQSAGQTAWITEGSGDPTDISLTTQAGTDDHVADNGSRSSTITHFTNTGKAAGVAIRYNGDATRGQSAWVYNGTDTVQTGLTGGEHLSTGASAGTAVSEVRFLNDAGDAAGISKRYKPDEASPTNGDSVWVHNASGTHQTGLFGDDPWVQDGTNFQTSTLLKLNQDGDAAGNSNRYVGADLAGKGSYFFNGADSSTQRIGLFDEEDAGGGDWTHATTGEQESAVLFLNEAGQAAGISERYNNNSVLGGISAWFFDSDLNGGAGQTIELTLAPLADNSNLLWTVGFLSEAGEVVGSYRPFGDDHEGEERAYYWTLAAGFHDLGEMVEGGLDAAPNFWEALTDALEVSASGHIRGIGTVETGGDYTMPFIMTAIPEPTGLALLAMTGLALLPRRRRRD